MEEIRVNNRKKNRKKADRVRRGGNSNQSVQDITLSRKND